MTSTDYRVGAEVARGPEQCVHCRNPIVTTDLGWTHINGSGQPLAWSCPLPHMTLASPGPRSTWSTHPTL